MSDLTKIRCVGCEGGIPALSKTEITPLLAELNQWEISSDTTYISKRFRFDDFYHTMAFVNAIAWIANQENHHPDLEVGYNYCNIKYTTHAVKGLTQNDFICAAKVDAMGG
jgi:4a-hydroxytetrahydrobiopterin dehydratase